MKIIQGIEAKVKSVCGDISQPWPPINERFALAKRLSNCQSRRKVGRTIRGRNLASLWNPLVTEMPWAGPLLRQGEQRLLSLGQVHDVPGRRHVLADVLGSLDPPEKGMWEYVNRVFFPVNQGLNAGHLDWHSMECVTPKLQAFLECGLRLHSNDRSAEWKLKWSAIWHSKGVHSVRWSA